MNKPQVEQIKAALIGGRTLTPKDALREFGSMRLAAVCHRLRTKNGWPIENIGDRKFGKYRIEPARLPDLQQTEMFQ